jgi:threonine/homoserine/homoserine lactone efflux protein
MSYELFGAFFLFAIVTLFTPGPNNIMLMTSGLNFGFRGAQAHIWGVTLGFSFMVLVVGLGLGAVFASYPALYAVIKYAGAAYIIYLAWIIARSDAVEEGKSRGGPITFLQAVGFQWVNPKGWVMVVGAITTYAAIARFPINVVLMAAVFGVFGLASSASWAFFGSSLRSIIAAPRSVRIFNIAMAILLVASLVPVFVDVWE